MTLDANTLCPGGSGKKIKHCGCRDIVNELEAIYRSLEGEQRVAALDRTNRLLVTKSNRPCLLALKASVLVEMENLQELDETVLTFLRVAPKNPVAHAYGSLVCSLKNDHPAAVDHLQQALESTDDRIPSVLFMAIRIVGQTLIREGEYVAGQGHLQLHAMLGNDQESVKPLLDAGGVPDVAPLLKSQLLFDDCPDTAPYAKRFREARMRCAKGCWRETAQQLELLDEKFPNQTPILRTLAYCYSCLADRRTVPALRRLAAAEDTPIDEAIDAEARAQLLEWDDVQPKVDVVQLTIDVTDANRLQEIMLSNKRVRVLPGDLSRFAPENSPPPKGVYLLLDRPFPAEDGPPTIDSARVAVGELMLFGKQTDREARVEVTVAKDRRFRSACDLLNELIGDLRAGSDQEEILTTLPRFPSELLSNYIFAEGILPYQRQQLMRQLHQRALETEWQTMPHPALDGKSPEEVAQDPSYRVRLAASLLVLEQQAEVHVWRCDVNKIRESLGVPVRGPLAIDAEEIGQLNPCDYDRVAVEQLDDEGLGQLFNNARIFGMRRASRHVGQEVLRRESLHGQVNKAALCGLLAELAEDIEESLEYLRQAKEWDVQQGKSPAKWLLNELPLQLIRGDATASRHILTLLTTHHMREPGVADTLRRIFEQFGISPEAGEPAEAAAAQTEEADSAEPGKIWTSESEPPAAEPQKDSKIWLPGMD